MFYCDLVNLPFSLIYIFFHACLYRNLLHFVSVIVIVCRLCFASTVVVYHNKIVIFKYPKYILNIASRIVYL